MKIKKVDDKPMVIHTKKKAKLHTHEPKKASIKASNIYTVDRSPKIKGSKIATTENKKFRRSTIHPVDNANQMIANTFRTFADKPTVDYSQQERKFSKTELVKKTWAAHKKLLQEVELRLDGAIERVENLSRDVEINKMLDTYDKVMEKAYGNPIPFGALDGITRESIESTLVQKGNTFASQSVDYRV